MTGIVIKDCYCVPGRCRIVCTQTRGRTRWVVVPLYAIVLRPDEHRTRKDAVGAAHRAGYRDR